MLCPVDGSALNYRALDAGMAELLGCLESPASIPVQADDDPTATVRQFAALVLDGVLEVEVGEEFLSGPAALPLLCEPAAVPQVDGRLARVSRAALLHAAALRLSCPKELAMRLYHFGNEPLTPELSRRWPGAASALDLVGREVMDGLAAALRAAWGRPEIEGGWVSFRRRGRDGRLDPAAPVYKLYISPVLTDLGKAAPVIAAALDRSAAKTFKLGADLYGVVRSDKIVAYFGDREAMLAAAEALASSLSGLRPHGVPFTGELALDGLLSWGIDPPRDQRAPGAPSWRTWITRRLASALTQAGHDSTVEAIPAWRFALERLRLDDVDVDRWIPHEQWASRASAV